MKKLKELSSKEERLRTDVERRRSKGGNKRKKPKVEKQVRRRLPQRQMGHSRGVSLLL